MYAIVLSRRDFRESDQIISLYTKENGKCELLARGVKKIISKNAAHLEPFSIVDIDIAEGHEIDHLTKVQPIEYFTAIRKDFQKSMAAQYVVTLADKLVQVGEQDRRIFIVLESWLGYINSNNLSAISHKILLDGYIVILLHCLGFTPSHSSKLVEWENTLEIMESGDWESVAESAYDEMLHRKLFEYTQYQTERQVADWAKTCII